MEAVRRTRTRTLVLAKERRTEYVITIGTEATPTERHAAKELAAFLGQSSGAEFPVMAPANAVNRPQIAVGPQAAQAAGADAQSLAGLGDEGILIQTLSSNLILSGGVNAQRGTLYAVYSFLEDHVGCRWWTPAVSHIPRLEKIVVPALDKRYVPALEYRENLYFGSFDGDWAVRNRLNGHFYLLDKIQGGHCKYAYDTWKGFVHTFSLLVPASEYYAKHPEWFALVGGKRDSGSVAQMCLTNKDLQQFMIQRVKAWLAEAPEATIVSVSQNDSNDACECPKCRAVDHAEGSPSGTLLRFVNGVAKALEKDYPRVAVDTLAYNYTRKPPRITKPRANVIVRLCSSGCGFGRPLTHASNRAFRKEIEGWAKICRRLYVWDYVTNFSNFIQPHPNWHVLDKNIRFFAQNNVKGVFEQGNNGSRGGEMAELRAWVIAKLLWDPSRDGKTLIQEFLKGYFGAAAPHIKKYMRCIYESMLHTRTCLSFGVPPEASFLTPQVLAKSLRYLHTAEKAVKSEPEIQKRVQLLKLPCWYVILSRWDSMGAIRSQGLLPATNKRRLFVAFEAACKKNGITHIGEGEGRSLELFRSHCLGEGPRPWLSPFIARWRISGLMPKGKGVSYAPVKTLAETTVWKSIIDKADYGFVNIHPLFEHVDGLVYLAARVKTRRKSSWTLLVGYDGGVRVFVDGKAVITDPQRINPAPIDRSKANIKLNQGEHEIVVALDIDHGLAWGIFVRFEQSGKDRARGLKPIFPECMT